PPWQHLLSLLESPAGQRYAPSQGEGKCSAGGCRANARGRAARTTTAPWRISRTISSSASERASHASRALLTLRHTRLTVPLHRTPKQGTVRAPHTQVS